MPNIWIVLGVTVAVVVVALPLAAIIMVSLASLREESARSLSGDAPSINERVARRVLGYHPTEVGSRSSRQTPDSPARDRTEVRFVHARRSVPDSGQLAAFGQSQPYRISVDQRERAGV